MKKKLLVFSLVIVLLVSSTVIAVETGMFEGFKIINVKVDGKEVKGDVPAILFNGRTMVPVKFISDALGATINFDDKTNTVNIVSPLPKTIEKVVEKQSQKTTGKINYNDGAFFEGEILNNQPNGYGKLTFSNKEVIEGSFSDGLINGLVKYYFSNGVIFGEYINGNMNGSATFYFNNGTIKNTAFKDGLEVVNNITPSNNTNNYSQTTTQQNFKQDNSTQISQIKAGLNTKLANYNSQEDQIKQKYYNLINIKQSLIDTATMNFAQNAAARGIKGNAAQMPEMYSAGLRSQIAELQQQEQSEISQIEQLKQQATDDADIQIQELSN